MVNQPIIQRLLNNLEGYINDLRRADDITVEKIIADVRSQRFVERTLQIAIECCFDVAHHIISDQEFREPTSYGDAFVVLGENNVFPMESAKQYQLIWQLRTKIVHYYDKLDPVQTFEIFRSKPNIFDKFRQQIITWLEASV